MDKMSSRERMIRFYSGEKIDRVPMLSCATMYAGRQEGLTSREFYFDMEKSYHAQKAVCERCGYDDSPCYDLPHGEILDLGGELGISDSGNVELPWVKRFAINSLEEAGSYELPPVKERRFTKLRIEFLKYAISQGTTGVSISAGSPFTMVGSMVETSLLMRWLVKEPELVKSLLDVAIRYLCQTADIMIEEFGLDNCSVSSNYPFESTNLISPRNFKKYALPAMLEVHERFREKGLRSFGIHLCGNHMRNLEFYKELELEEGSFVSSDEQNDLKEVAKVLGDGNIYAGNVSTRLLADGTPQQVYRQSEEIIQEMKYHPGGFVLMPSCDLPVNTVPENLQAMLQAVRDFGRYD